MSKRRSTITFPSGWKLVPIEPTWTQINALVLPLGEERQHSFGEVYGEMVKAVPQPKSEAETADVKHPTIHDHTDDETDISTVRQYLKV
jgi:hypothetical protein